MVAWEKEEQGGINTMASLPPSPFSSRPALLCVIIIALQHYYTYTLQCAIQMRIIFSVHFRWRSVVPLPVLPSPSPRRPSIVGVGTRCDKGSWQSYLFWINVRICRPRRSIVGGANVTSEAILSSNTNAQLSANNSLWLNTKKVGFVFIETT